jgi:hypothetical protein
MQKAGYEYADFQNTIIVGQRIDVVVKGINIGNHNIDLDLARNI